MLGCGFGVSYDCSQGFVKFICSGIDVVVLDVADFEIVPHFVTSKKALIKIIYLIAEMIH